MRSVLLTCLVLAWAVSVAAEEQWLQYRSGRDPGRSGVSVLWMPLENDDGAGVELPPAVKSGARFARWKTPLAPEGFVRVASFAAGAQGSHDRIVVDSNVDGRLSDETVLLPARSARSQRLFEAVKIVFPGEDGRVTYHVSFMLSPGIGKSSIQAASACWYEGTVKIGGRDYVCRLIDYNANGAFDDAESGHGGDQIGLGQPSGRDYSQMVLGRYVSAGGVLHAVKPARDGACVEFVEAKEVPTGTLVFPAGMTRLVIAGPLGQMNVVPVEGRAGVPAGTWRIFAWRIDKTDKTGAWTLSGGGAPRELEFAVPAGGEFQVNAGEPITGALAVTKSGRSYSFTQALVGSLGEQVQLLRSGGLPPAPKVRIRNADASYDKTFSFSYG